MRSSARMAPVRPNSTPACAASSTLGLNPAATTTRSQATSATLAASMALTLTPQRSSTPCFSSCLRTAAVRFASSRSRTFSEPSSTVTRSPLRRSASAASTPMYPAPITTARRGRFSRMKRRMRSASSMVRSVKTWDSPAPTMPAVSQRAPAAMMRWS